MAKRTSKIGVLTLAAVALLVLGGCQTTGYPVGGLWTQDVRVPIDGKIGRGKKEGKACATSYMGVYAMGDASVAKAAENGGIKKIQSVEALVNARIVIGTYCTIVRGS